jgi:hypothetical protein
MDTFGTLVAGIAALNAVGLLVTAFSVRRTGQSPVTPPHEIEAQKPHLATASVTKRENLQGKLPRIMG